MREKYYKTIFIANNNNGCESMSVCVCMCAGSGYCTVDGVLSYKKNINIIWYLIGCVWRWCFLLNSVLLYINGMHGV